jgi:hypothetical protein
MQIWSSLCLDRFGVLQADQALEYSKQMPLWSSSYLEPKLTKDGTYISFTRAAHRKVVTSKHTKKQENFRCFTYFLIEPYQLPFISGCISYRDGNVGDRIQNSIECQIHQGKSRRADLIDYSFTYCLRVPIFW